MAALVGGFWAFRGWQGASHEAVVWLRIRGEPDDPGGFEDYHRHLIGLLKSPLILHEALQKPGVTGLATIAEEKDPVRWLDENLQVVTRDFSQVVQLKLRGSRPGDLRLILHAVTMTYLDDLVAKDRDDSVATRESLRAKYREDMAELQSRLEAIRADATAAGLTDGIDEATRKELLLGEIAALRERRTGVLVETDSLRAAVEEAERLGEPADPRRVVRLAILEKQAEGLTAEMDAAVRRLADGTKARAEFDARVSDLEILERVTDQVRRQLDANALELSRPPRVMLLEGPLVDGER